MKLLTVDLSNVVRCRLLSRDACDNRDDWSKTFGDMSHNSAHAVTCCCPLELGFQNRFIPFVLWTHSSSIIINMSRHFVYYHWCQYFYYFVIYPSNLFRRTHVVWQLRLIHLCSRFCVACVWLIYWLKAETLNN